MGRLTDQFFEGAENYREKKRQRIYLKDIDCPPVWHDKLREHIPPGLFYLNETVGDVGGYGSVDETEGRKSRGIGRSGDLMSSLPTQMRAENLMCYIGHEGTYTPSHREMCASLGQNIMVEASGLVGEDGQPERAGSSLWFMTETKDRHLVSEYWLSVLGHDIEVENHFAQVNAWIHAPFTTYVVEQKPGDFLLIPPLAPHQVWNRGTRTMKVAWNRTTVETLEMALNEALPNARMVCRDEQYKNKAIVYYTLAKYSILLRQVKTIGESGQGLPPGTKIKHLQRDFKRTFELFKSILLSEMFNANQKEHPEFLPYDGNVTCAYCRGNIFNRFLTCKSCPRALGTDVDEPYDICMECYVMGRSCSCQSDLKWVEQWRWRDLLRQYEEWRNQIIDIDGGVTEKTPLPLLEERRYYGKKTLGQICQEQLRLRPWVDINNPQPPEDEEDENAEILVDDDGQVKKVAKKKSKTWLSNNKPCHVCLHKHPKWKMVACTSCDLWYCFGTLFRAHDLMPQSILENLNWVCPHCRRVCNTGACRRDPRQKPYEPQGTLLGHDTKKVADVRSVEALVDFGVSNLNWLRDMKDGNAPFESSRMQRRLAEAEWAKSNNPEFDERYMDTEIRPPNAREDIIYSPADSPTNGNDHMIDPALGGDRRFHESDSLFMPDNSQVDVDGEFEHESPRLYSQHVTDGMLGYQDENGDYYQPDPIDVANDSPRKRQRGEDQIKLVTSKRRKKSKKGEVVETPRPQAPVGAVGKFKKEQEKKQFEDARRTGRYIILWGAKYGKSKVVTLSLNPGQLAAITARTPAHAIKSRVTNSNRSPDVIIQSDVLKPKSQTRAVAKQKSGPTFTKLREEEDEEFVTGKRRRDRSGKKSRASARAEDSDSDEQDEEELAYRPESTKRDGRRKSNWLERKNRGEDADLPTELPSDFRDGTVNNKRRRATSGTERSAIDLAQSATAALADEQLRIAKMAANELNGTGAASGSDSAATPSPAPPAVSQPVSNAIIGKSIFSRPGKKIKIVGAPKGNAATPATPTPDGSDALVDRSGVSAFTPANARSRVR